MRTRPPSRIGTYIYCVGYAEPLRGGAFETRGIGGPDDVVRTVEYDNLAAVVSDAPRTRHDISRDNLLAHQRVIEEAMSRTDILPAAFGMISASDEEVREKLLRFESDALQDALEYVRGRSQLGLTVLWNREQLFSEIVAEDETIRALRDATVGQSEDATYYERIRIGELTEAAISRKRGSEAEEILYALEPLAVETALNDNVSDMMILSAAFLVDRDQLETFDAQVDALGRAQSGRLIFRYVGPLPPYNFVNLAVNWEE
jgi:hypothetical protein